MNTFDLMKVYCGKCIHKGACHTLCPTVLMETAKKRCPWCGAVIAETDKYCHECGWYLGRKGQSK